MVKKDNFDGECDIAIIGAGIGGLTCGALLAKKGLKVMIFEQHYKVGGYCTSFKRRGFTFDPCIHVINGCGPNGQIGKILSELGIDKEIEFILIDPFDTIVFPNKQELDIPINYLHYKDRLEDLFPKEKNGLNKYFEIIIKIYQELFQVSSLQTSDKKISFSTVIKYVNEPFSALLEECFNDSVLRKIIGIQCSYAGVPPSKASLIYVACLLSVFHLEGTYYPKGGAQVFAELFANCIRRNGGKIWLGEMVEKIYLKDKEVIGLGLKSGFKVKAKYIVSNVDARQTFFNLIGKNYLRKSFIDKLIQMEQSNSIFAIYLGVDMNSSALGIKNTCYWILPSWDYENTYSMACQGLIPKEIPIVLLSPSLKDPTLVPKGKNSVIIGTMFPYQYYVAHGIGKEEVVANVLLKRAEEIIPSISDHIIVKEIATPKTFEKFTLNSEGAPYGFANTPQQSGLNKLRQKTPIKGLYLAGHYTIPGSGVASVALSGKFAANIIFNELNKEYERK